VDALGVAAAHALPGTALEVLLAESPPAIGWTVAPTLSPVLRSWWRFEEPAVAAGNRTIYDSGPRALTGTSFNVTGGAAPVAPDPYGYSWGGNGSNGFALLGGQGDSSTWAGVAVPFTIGFWVQCGQRAGTSFRMIYNQGASPTRFSVQIRVPDTGLTTAGQINTEFRGGGITFFGNAVTKRVDDGEPHWVTINYYNIGGTGYKVVGIDDQSYVTSAANAPYFLTQDADYSCVVGATANGPGNYFDGQVDELVLLSGAAQGADNDLTIAARDSTVWRTTLATGGTYPDDRTRAVLSLMGWPTALTDVPARATAGLSNRKMTGHQFTGEEAALGLLADAADAEGGALVATLDGKLKLIGGGTGAAGRPSTVSATWGDATGELPYEGLTLERSKVLNEVRVRRSGDWWPTAPAGAASLARDAASVTKYRERRLNADVPLVAVAARDAYAAAILADRATPRTRLRELTVAPTTSAAVADAVLATRLEDLHRVRHSPPGAGYTIDAQVRVAGIAHRWTRDKWRTTLSLGT
jgi:hypothetical protein